MPDPSQFGKYAFVQVGVVVLLSIRACSSGGRHCTEGVGQRSPIQRVPFREDGYVNRVSMRREAAPFSDLANQSSTEYVVAVRQPDWDYIGLP